jgi:16S rRNA processing protein RimM
MTVERSRAFKDGWLVKFAGIEDKTEADKWRGVDLSADEAGLAPPDENEVYLDELTGMTVRDEPHGELGIVAGFYELPQGLVLEVRGAQWKADIPFNEAFVESVDRKARLITVTLPDGLLEPSHSQQLTPPTQPQG